MEITPKSGLKGLIENWRNDLMAAVSVSLVALPLGLGIALASGVPAISGVFSAIIGGIVTTFFRGSHIAINGPTAGLITVILTAIASMEDGSGKTLNYVFAAVFMAGALQVLMGLLKMGKFADLFHSTVIHGILAAIGVIIIAKQIHIALGTPSDAENVIDSLVDVIVHIPDINPFVAVISLIGLFLLIFHSRISYKFFHFLPAPMWVMVLSVPFVYIFNFFEPHSLSFLGKEYEVGPHLLISIPDNILNAIILPDFSKIHTTAFWLSVISITMIASIESLASGKAIDKLDPYRRKSNPNKDLIGIGLSTMLCGALGGLPIINVIVRSTVNIHNNAKTKWSNFYHGILLVLFVFLLGPLLQNIPLCALAILLVFIGFKLASPKVFQHIFSQGVEQLIFFVGTLVITLFTNLLVGVFGGLTLVLITHFLLAKMPMSTFLKMILFPQYELQHIEGNAYELAINGVANFLSALKIDTLLESLPAGAKLTVDLSGAQLVGYSILENLYDFQKIQTNRGGEVKIKGLDKHISSSNHKLALKMLLSPIHKLTNRQIKLKNLAAAYDWNFEAWPVEDPYYFQTFHFFKSREVEEIINSTWSEEPEGDFEIVDVQFEEGAFQAYEEYDTTLGVIKFPKEIPEFSIEKKSFPERFLHLSSHKDIDYEIYEDFPDNFIVRVEDKIAMKGILSREFEELIKNSKVIHHLESNGEAILLFMDNLRLAHIGDYPKIVEFAMKLKQVINSAQNTSIPQ